MNKIVLSSLAALVALVAAAAPAAAVPTQVSFAGRLTTADGPVEGSVELRFALYSGSVRVWEEEHDVTAEAGLVFVSLGSEVPLDAGVFTGGPLQLEIVIDGEPSSPRLPILSVPYAGRAGNADSADTLGGQPASAFAAASHDHAGVYLPLGATLACGVGLKMTGLSATGNVICATDQIGSVGSGLELDGSTFSIAGGGVTSAHISNGTVSNLDMDDDAIRSINIENNTIARADINGLEPALYRRSPYCSSSGGELSMSGSSCSTGICNPIAALYFTCAGSCSSTTAVSCAPTMVGRLLAPDID